MKQVFHAHYHLSRKEVETLWKDGLIVPDASVLLTLYRYSPSTRSALMKLMASLRSRLWFPHQAGLEFLRNRPHVVFEERAKYQPLFEAFGDIIRSLETTRGHPFVSPQLSKRLKRIHRDLEREFARSAEELERFVENDPLLDEITSLFDGRVGPAFSDEEAKELRAEGENRYKLHIPPGFADERKGTSHNKFGDLFVWKQILREAESQKKGVILINDDLKQDWWIKVEGGKAIGPLPALREEFFSKTGQNFYMYPSEKFLELAGTMLSRQIPKEAIQEVKETRVARSLADSLSVQVAEVLARQRETRSSELENFLNRTAAERSRLIAAIQQATNDDINRATAALSEQMRERMRSRGLGFPSSPEGRTSSEETPSDETKGDTPPIDRSP